MIADMAAVKISPEGHLGEDPGAILLMALVASSWSRSRTKGWQY